jgi:chromosome segregation ATPase
MKRILGLLILLHAPFAAAVYKCVDEKGNTLFGDVPPAGCGNVPIYEVSKSGMVVRKIEPTPTPEQVKERQEEQARRKRAEALAAEQKRQDMALLNSYTNAIEFDVARDRNIEPVQGRIASAQERLKELDQNEKQLHETGEHYRTSKEGSGEVPAWITANIDNIGRERKTLQAAILQYRKEIETLRSRYDSDKRRWIALKASAGRLPDGAQDAAPEPVKAPAKK